MGRSISDVEMAVVRRFYEGDAMTVAEISAFTGVAPSTIRRRAEMEGWPRRPRGGRVVRGRGRRPVIGRPPATDASDPADATEVAAAVDRQVLIGRLWMALDRYLQEEEAGLHASDGRRPQTLDVLVRTIERLSGLERGVEPAGTDGGTESDEALRAELLARIEGLAEEGDGAG